MNVSKFGLGQFPAKKPFLEVIRYKLDGSYTVHSQDAKAAVDAALTDSTPGPKRVYVVYAYPQTGRPFPTFAVIDGVHYALHES